MAYDAKTIANYFLDLANKEGRWIDPMGIQKLVYFAHGWNLAILDEPLIKQRVEAWEYGPVISDLYQEFKEFGRYPITRLAKKLERDENGLLYEYIPVLEDSAETKKTRELLDRVWETHKHLSSVQLSNMTHLPGSPWTTAREQGKSEIDDSLIADYIKDQARQNAHVPH